MADVTGKGVRLKIGDGGTPTEVFTTVAKSSSDSITINNSIVEVNHKDSGVFRDIAAGGSITSITVSSSFIFTDQADVDRLKTVSMAADKSINARLVDGAGDEFDGTWFLASFEITGEVEGNANASVTLESNGTITLQTET